MAFGGSGVGRCDGKVVFIPLTAPGETVRFRVVSDEGRFEKGEVAEVVTPSSQRVTPRCSVFGSCGGCQWQHLDYAEQLRSKEAILQEALHRVVSSFQMLPIIPADHPWNYRHRIQLKSDGRNIGFYGRGNHQVIPFEQCEIADPLLNEEVKKIRTNQEDLGEEFELCVEGGVVQRLKRTGSERVFSQVNTLQNQKLRDEVVDFVFGRADHAFTRQKNVVELYAGSGNLTFSLAQRAGRVVAVEENRAAVERLVEVCVSERLSHVECVTGTAEWGLKKLYRRQFPIDVLILDPPRSGAKDLLDLILVMKPRAVVYVSCDPTTLARDIKGLARGYRLNKVRPIDMFPQTYHIESVSELVRI